MKVLLYDDLFYYTIVMHSDMQELMWAAECMHFVLSTIIKDGKAGINSASCELACSCVCTVCTVARLALAISCSPVI